jgi:hypothetical protein
MLDPPQFALDDLYWTGELWSLLASKFDSLGLHCHLCIMKAHHYIHKALSWLSEDLRLDWKDTVV